MDRFTKVRALVTGGAGFIGSHLVDALFADGAARVAVVDDFFLGKEENLAQARDNHGAAPEIYRENAGDPAAMAVICEAERPDVIFNLATRALLYSFFNPPGAYRVNVDIALALAELLRRGAYGRLIHVSSSEVYGTAQTVPMNESHPLLAETSYAAGKAAADLLLASYVNMFNLDVVTVRPFNNYGPRQNDGSLVAIVPLTIRRLLAGEQPVIEGDGTQTRDFTYVEDTVEAIMKLTAKGAPKGHVFNVGSGEETSVSTLVKKICEAIRYEGETIHREARVADVRRHCADIERITRLIGPVARTPLEEGLTRTVAWYRGNQN